VTAPTLEAYAEALRAARPEVERWRQDRVGPLTITNVEARSGDVLVTMQYRHYPHTLVHALNLDSVLLYGGDLPTEEAPVEMWAAEALDHLAFLVRDGGLTSTRRRAFGDAVEIDEPQEPSHDFVAGHFLADDYAIWQDAAQWADPLIPPRPIKAWRTDGSLITWNTVHLEHRYPLPVLGHAATRWRSDGVAELAFLTVATGLPDLVPIMLAADAALSAAFEGAHTVVSELDRPDLAMLGFREIAGAWHVDTRFLDVDHAAIGQRVSSVAHWDHPKHLRDAITEASKHQYFAG
jgi:hypothetical protein